MSTTLHRERINDIALTDHCDTKGFDTDRVKDIVDNVTGQLFWDSRHQAYVLYNGGRGIAFHIDAGVAVVRTVYGPTTLGRFLRNDRFSEVHVV